MRNLLIATHVREATFGRSGKRVLVIIGAAHKPFLDRILGQTIDVKVVSLGDVVTASGAR